VPEAQVNELNRAFRKVVENAGVKDKLRASGVELQASSPAELNALVQADLARWKQVILAHEIKPE
jgi:tripartite-type tricarboxylate transporter receptor subunit TctC